MSIRTSLKKVLPAISITEQEALEAGDVWLESSIYQGKPDMQALRNVPTAKLNADEQAFLDRLARKLDISEGDYKEILKDYKSHAVNPPSSYDRRLERLYDLARMVYADHELGERQTRLLERLCVGLGFSTANVNYVVDKALKLVHAGVDEDNFIDEIKNMNR